MIDINFIDPRGEIMSSQLSVHSSTNTIRIQGQTCHKMLQYISQLHFMTVFVTFEAVFVFSSKKKMKTLKCDDVTDALFKCLWSDSSPDEWQQAAGGGGPSGPGLLPGGSAAAAGLREPAQVWSGSRSAALSAPARLYHRDPPQTLPRPPAGPAAPAGG